MPGSSVHDVERGGCCGTNITDTFADMLSLSCICIEYVDISRNVDITGSSILALCVRCAPLVYINVSYCTMISNVGMHAAATLPVLRTLFAASSLTDASAHALMSMPRLRKYELHHAQPELEDQLDRLYTRCYINMNINQLLCRCIADVEFNLHQLFACSWQ